MADDVRAARREARRRRILENSENRLQRITGRHESGSKDYTTTGEEETSWKGSIQRDVTNGLIRPIKVQQTAEEQYESAGSKYADEILRRVQICNSAYNRFDAPADDSSNEEVATAVKVVEQRARRPRFFLWNLHFVCVAVATRMLFAFELGHTFSELMFLPLLLLVLIEMLTQTVNPSNTYGILGGTLILIGLPPHLVTTCAYCISIASYVVGVFAIYLVSFTMTDCILNSVISADTV